MSRDDSLRHGISRGSARARQQQIEADNRAIREADQRNEQEWRRAMAKKVKNTPYGPVKRPPNPSRAEDGLDTLGELLGDIADSIREADQRERVIDSATSVDERRFPAVRSQR
jgi:hypothetical protein